MDTALSDRLFSLHKIKGYRYTPNIYIFHTVYFSNIQCLVFLCCCNANISEIGINKVLIIVNDETPLLQLDAGSAARSLRQEAAADQ